MFEIFVPRMFTDRAAAFRRIFSGESWATSIRWGAVNWSLGGYDWNTRVLLTPYDGMGDLMRRRAVVVQRWSSLNAMSAWPARSRNGTTSAQVCRTCLRS